jgi:hypothetical protein
MTQELYDNLWHYSELFSRDPLQRSELLTMAWKEGERLGERCTPGLMKSMMHFRSKELNRRSAFPATEMGKRTLDAWNHERVYIDKPVGQEKPNSLADFLLPVKSTPLDFAIVSDFTSALTDEEQIFLNDLTAGYNLKEISRRQHLDNSCIQSLRQSLQTKAVAYL